MIKAARQERVGGRLVFAAHSQYIGRIQRVMVPRAGKRGLFSIDETPRNLYFYNRVLSHCEKMFFF